MARKATGKVIEPGGKQKSYAIRFTAYGKRRFISLGRPEDGYTRDKAEAELRHVLADVERGLWTPAVAPTTPLVKDVPTFHVFASEWLEAREPELAEETVRDYRWCLVDHLLPFFAQHPLTSITIQEVDRYKTAKVREGKLSNNSINKTITRLSMVLEVAVEYGLIPANPAAGRRRRLKRETPNRPHVEPEQLPALLEAASKLDRARRGRRTDLKGPGNFPGPLDDQRVPSDYRPIAKPLLLTLAGGGLRIGEALDLEWRDVNLGGMTLKVRASKTAAGVREVDLTPAVASELKALKAARGSVNQRDPVFASYHHGRDDRSRPAKLDRHRVRERILKPAVKEANKILVDKDIEPIGKVTLHGLRRTFASLKFAVGDDPVYVAQQLGHTDPTFSMKVYAKAVKRRARLTGETLKAFDEALELAESGRNSADGDRFGFRSESVKAPDPASEVDSKQCARQDSNLRPRAPEARALSS